MHVLWLPNKHRICRCGLRQCWLQEVIRVEGNYAWSQSVAFWPERRQWLRFQENFWAAVLWRCSFCGRKGIRPVKNWVVGCSHVICLRRGADLHMAQLMPLPLTVSCSSKSRLVVPFWYRLNQVVPDWIGTPRAPVPSWNLILRKQEIRLTTQLQIETDNCITLSAQNRTSQYWQMSYKL